MKIVTVPHPALRKTAVQITTIDKKVISFVEELKKTLTQKNDPPGVGLAGPQVDKNYRVFATNLPDINNATVDDDFPSVAKAYINPVIVGHSKNKIFGPDDNNPTLEGCLSIPNLYGPVPRWDEIELEFDQIINGQLKRTNQKFKHFTARVIQHELDHLDGILFTDYSLEFDLPVFSEDKRKRKLIEVDKKMIEIF